jgi:hypothetical protein
MLKRMPDSASDREDLRFLDLLRSGGGHARKVELMKLLVLVTAAFAIAPAYAGGTAAITSYPPEWPHRAPWKLNRELLLPETERIVFVVDAPRGSPPDTEALSHLVALAQSYGGRPATWVRLGDAGAPQVRWVDPAVPPKPVKYYVRLRDGETLDEFKIPQDDVETLRLYEQVPTCPNGALPTGVSYVFVRYLGYLGNGYGNANKVVSDDSCGGRAFPIIRMAQTRMAKDRPPGLGQSFLEQRGLSHEYGHVLGLASNPAHGRWLSTVPYRHGAHCIHRECAVAVATVTAVLKGQMLDYCAACRRDIEQAREHWRTGKEFPEAQRLPQPDPAPEVARLKKYNFAKVASRQARGIRQGRHAGAGRTPSRAPRRERGITPKLRRATGAEDRRRRVRARPAAGISGSGGPRARVRRRRGAPDLVGTGVGAVHGRR